jgi:hypothetical protein
MDTDTAITRITRAATVREAEGITATLQRRDVLAVADQLHIETEGHGMPWLRRAIVTEARS